MSFLLRLILLLALICVLFPAGNTQLSEEAQIDGKQAINLARAAVSDARGFCERQPDACSAGSKIATALFYKIEAGARTLYGFVSEFVVSQLSQKATDAPAPSKKAAAPSGAELDPVPVRQHGTLIPGDMRPSWHGPVPLRSSGELPSGQPSN